MKLLTSAATGLIAFAIATSAQAQAQANAQANAQAGAQPSVKISAKAQPAILELQNAVTANDRTKIPGALAAAQAAAQNNDDRWYIAGLQMKAALAAKDYNGMSSAIDAILASGHITPDKAAENYKTIATEQYNAKDYAGAAVQFGKAIKLQPNDTDGLSLLSQSLLLGGKAAEAATVAQRAIAASSTGGAKANEQLYRVAVQAAFDAKSPQLADIAQKWLAAYPSADAWRNNLVIFQTTEALNENGALALMRLMDVTGSLKPAEYSSYIKELLLQSNFNEAHAVLDRAIAAKAIDAGSAQAAAVKAKPTASAVDLTAAAKTAQSAMAVLKIGDRFYGMGEYAKAADLYRQAKAKGVDAPTADLFTGVALARAGDKAGARALLSSVTGPHAGIAKYWLIYLDQHA